MEVFRAIEVQQLLATFQVRCAPNIYLSVLILCRSVKLISFKLFKRGDILIQLNANMSFFYHTANKAPTFVFNPSECLKIPYNSKTNILYLIVL